MLPVLSFSFYQTSKVRQRLQQKPPGKKATLALRAAVKLKPSKRQTQTTSPQILPGVRETTGRGRRTEARRRDGTTTNRMETERKLMILMSKVFQLQCHTLCIIYPGTGSSWKQAA